MENKPWGFHLILDVKECNVIKATNPKHIKKFSDELVKRIDMIPYGEPQIVHFCDGDQQKAGWTLIQLIQTSNIMGHFVDHQGDAYLDVFSCKEFDPEIVLQTIKEYFSPKSINWRFVSRDVNNLSPDEKNGTINYINNEEFVTEGFF